MATDTTEPRALTAALSGPAFATKAGGLAMHAANRHVERWAPEADTTRVRSMRSLGFVDRLVTPWLETAQRSAGLRMFSQYTSGASTERPATQTSWLFPRPWYQDELDWLAAARQVQAQTQAMQAPQSAPALLTTRGTYVPRTDAPQMLPAAVYEYVAPSLSVAQPAVAGGSPAASPMDAYSPLVPLAAASAAQLVTRAAAPLAQQGQLSPGLRAVLATMIERAAHAGPEAGLPGSMTRGRAAEVGPTRLSAMAPELVTPPAPRPEQETRAGGFDEATPAAQIAERYAQQRAQIAELERVARVAAQKEIAARAAAQAPASSTTAPAAAATATPTAAASRPLDVSAERTRIEERIRERLAERQAQAQRLHEQSRDAAARDAQKAVLAEASVPAASTAPASAASPASVLGDVAAAMAGLPPELTSYISRRPERAAQAIAELGDALRTVELLARNAATGGALETTRGPRVMMPAGLGGLVATVDRAMPASALFAAPQPVAPEAVAQPARTLAARVPAPAWLAAPGRAPATTFSASIGPASALGAATQQAPNAVHHVAWADRWLARFAGARSESLDVLSATAARPESRLSALAVAAPEGVFVAPTLFDSERAATDTALRPDVRLARAESVLRGAAPIEVARPEPVRRDERPAAVRIDDAAETPDDVFAAISAAASRSRGRVDAPAAAASASAAASAPMMAADRATYADVVAHATPAAPGAGFAAQLASSPFAAALRHVLPLAAAPTFDVRALFGGNLSATFLAGLLAPETRELAIGADALPIAAWGEPTITGDVSREVPGFEATYVSPVEPSTFGDAEATAAVSQPEARSPRPEALSAPALTTLRTALLSWDVEMAPALAAASSAAAMPSAGAEVSASAQAAQLASTRAVLESLALLHVAEPAAAREPAWTMPGMTAERAQSWSVAQERSTADLSFDFVPPELVLAARVYGLGPAEAAQAMRLAIAGPGGLTTMASSVDRAFVQALAVEAERREGGARTAGAAGTIERPVTAFPTSSMTSASSPVADRISFSTTSAPLVAPSSGATAAALAQAGIATSGGTGAFGVERRAPRGSFLWPSATVGALGIQAAAPDGEQSMSVAAIELLAARAVAELGTFAALGERPAASEAAQHAATGTGTGTGTGDERDVIASATSLVPSARRAKFEALYLAVAQSPNGRNLSPAARAARALALAGRGEDTITARERAAIAWDVLPHVQVGDDGATGSDGEPLSTGAAASRETQRRALSAQAASFELPVVESRPGLANLSGRAGEALGSYVTPTAAAPAPAASSSRESQGAAMRAPSAAQELVRTGRPSSRVGGGEVEIPSWFEAAARKMLDERSGASDGISLAELTLVSAAPSNAVAASTRGAPSAVPAAPTAGKSPEAGGKDINVEEVANEVYQAVLGLMDAARARNGEPYL